MSSSAVRLCQPAACVLFLLLSFSAWAMPGQSAIAIEDLSVDPRGDSSVRFTNPVVTPRVRIDLEQRMKMRPYPSDDKLYVVYVAFDRTAPTTPPLDINYYLYSQAATTAEKDVFTEYVVVGTPRGDFSDQWSWVRYHLDENGIHSGSLELPIHSFSNEALIFVEPDSGAGTVYLSQPDHKLSFSTKNSLKGLVVYVDGADLTTNNEYYWKWSGSDRRYPVVFDARNPNAPFVLTAAPRNGTATVRPDLWKSLQASAGGFRSDQSQDVLNLTVRYSAEFGGNPRALSIPIKIRFRPPWWSLFGCAVLGSILGSLITLRFPETWKATTKARTIGSAVLLAILAEFLGLLMFLSDGSKLAIAGFNLNPTEVLPAAGLGLLVGLLGIKVFDAFKIPLPTR